MDRRETERLLDAIRQARAAGEPAAMATVVRVKGSAYRREGTRMFVRRNGTYECALSGGCLEPTVAEAAARVIATGEPVIVSYDLADDSIWGLGIGCSGAVDIRIERIGDDAITNDWLTILERGEAAVLVTPLSGVSGRMIVRGTGDIVGGLDRSDGRAAGGRTCPRAACGAVSGVRSREIGSADVFYEITMPPPDLGDLRRRTRRGARRAAGLDARVRGDRRRCPRSVPDAGAVSAARRGCARISASSPSA